MTFKCPECRATIKYLEYTEEVGGVYDLENDEYQENDDTEEIYFCPKCQKEIDLDEVQS